MGYFVGGGGGSPMLLEFWLSCGKLTPESFVASEELLVRNCTGLAETVGQLQIALRGLFHLEALEFVSDMRGEYFL